MIEDSSSMLHFDKKRVYRIAPPTLVSVYYSFLFSSTHNLIMMIKSLLLFLALTVSLVAGRRGPSLQNNSLKQHEHDVEGLGTLFHISTVSVFFCGSFFFLLDF